MQTRIVEKTNASGIVTYEPQKKVLWWWFNMAPGTLFYTEYECEFYMRYDSHKERAL